MAKARYGEPAQPQHGRQERLELEAENRDLRETLDRERRELEKVKSSGDPTLATALQFLEDLKGGQMDIMTNLNKLVC